MVSANNRCGLFVIEQVQYTDFSNIFQRSNNSSLMFTTSDAVGSVTWLEPPPVETVTDSTLVHTNSTKLRKGSTNVHLNWEFSLTSELNLILVTIRLDGTSVGAIVPSTGDASPGAGFTSRFNVSWVAQVATLTIFNVTSADEGLFTCELNTFEAGTNKIWRRNIDVSVVGKHIICSLRVHILIEEVDANLYV